MLNYVGARNKNVTLSDGPMETEEMEIEKEVESGKGNGNGNGNGRQVRRMLEN